MRRFSEACRSSGRSEWSCYGESLVRSARYHPYGDAAMYSLMDVRLHRMNALGHAADKEPTDAQVERTYEKNGNTVQVYALTDEIVTIFGPVAPVLGCAIICRATRWVRK